MALCSSVFNVTSSHTLSCASTEIQGCKTDNNIIDSFASIIQQLLPLLVLLLVILLLP